MSIHGISLGLWLCAGCFPYRSAQHAPVAHRVRAGELGMRTAPAARSLAVAHRRVGTHGAFALDAGMPAHRRARVEARGRQAAVVPAADTSAHFIPFILFGVHHCLLLGPQEWPQLAHSGGQG